VARVAEAVKLARVTKYFGATRVLENINLSLQGQKYHVILGPSGSGKTTLLRIIAGLEEPTQGKVYLKGVDATNIPPYERSVSMVFQEPVLFPHLTVEDNILFPIEARGDKPSSARSELIRLARMLGIENLLKRKPDELSGGEKQRVSIARALITKPDIVLLDEPYSNLDLSLRESLRWEIKDILKKLGVTVIHVTHDQDEALELADYIHVIYNGRLADTGPKDRVYWSPATSMAARVLAHNIIKIDGKCVVTPIDGVSINPDGCEKPVEASLREVRDRRGYRLAVYQVEKGLIKISVPKDREVPEKAFLCINRYSILNEC
jgi:ABC-type sugar transport system ATPase subunit